MSVAVEIAGRKWEIEREVPEPNYLYPFHTEYNDLNGL